MWTNKNHLRINTSEYSNICFSPCYLIIEAEAIQEVFAHVSLAIENEKIESVAMLYSSVISDILFEN